MFLTVSSVRRKGNKVFLKFGVSAFIHIDPKVLMLIC